MTYLDTVIDLIVELDGKGYAQSEIARITSAIGITLDDFVVAWTEAHRRGTVGWPLTAPGPTTIQ